MVGQGVMGDSLPPDPQPRAPGGDTPSQRAPGANAPPIGAPGQDTPGQRAPGTYPGMITDAPGAADGAPTKDKRP